MRSWAKLALLVLLAAGCAKPPPEAAPKPSASPIAAAEALAERDWQAAAERLAAIAASAPEPEATDARLARAEILLRHAGLDAEAEALAAAIDGMDRPQAARVWLAVAEARLGAKLYEDAVAAAAQALLLPQLPEALVADILSVGERAQNMAATPPPAAWLAGRLRALRKPDERAAEGFALAAGLDLARFSAILETVPLDSEALYALARAFVLQALIGGDAALAEAAQALVARRNPEIGGRLRALFAEGHEATIGLVLPKAGFAPWLEGARLAGALAEPRVHTRLRIEYAADAQEARSAMTALVEEGAEALVVAGEALLPAAAEAEHLSVPVVALGKGALASHPPNLMLMPDDPATEAPWIAHKAREAGAARMVVLAVPDAEAEAQAFATAFTALGGEVLEVDTIPADGDARAVLLGIRKRTDDEELLYALDEDLALFSPDPDLIIRMPPGFDAVFLAAPGKTVFLLAAQLAWAGIDTPIYGTSRWDDGHLLDDRGRYLARVRFAAAPVNAAPTPDLRRAIQLWRDAWHPEAVAALPSRATWLMFDAVRMLVEVLGARGLKGMEAVKAISTMPMFPGALGAFRFDEGHRILRMPPLFTIRGGRIEPAG